MNANSNLNPTGDTPSEGPVVACIDFSEDSREALLWAARYAGNCATPLVLLHIVHDLASHPGFYHPEKTDQLEPMQTVAASMMDDFLEDTRKQHPDLPALATAGVRLVPGLPPTRIVEVAGLLKASLIVLGGHGMAQHSHKRLGAVAERVAEMSRIPTVIVKQKSAPLSDKELKRQKKRQKKERKMLKKLLGVASGHKTEKPTDG
jgi:nucleotide-binding universal stress UspA family protein